MIFSKEDNFILVKIFKSYLKNFDIYDKEQIINLFKIIFIKIKKNYNLSGLFDVDIYVNGNYGMIIEINNLFYNDKECDINIKIHLDAIFLNIICSNDVLDYDEVYYYHDNFYGIYKEICDKEVIYKNVDKIMNEGIKLY